MPYTLLWRSRNGWRETAADQGDAVDASDKKSE